MEEQIENVDFDKNKKNKSNNKKIVISIFVVCVFVILIIVIFLIKNEKKDNEEIIENVLTTNEIIEENTIKIDEIVEDDLPEKMGNYNVIGELVIDKIGVKNYILDKTEDESLKLSVTKFWGPNVNEIGNLSITGHNYKELLKRLDELEVGDTFYLISKAKRTKVTYEIYDIFTCYPTEVECIDQPTEQVREVTLITCNPGGLTRLICKAMEI